MKYWDLIKTRNDHHVVKNVIQNAPAGFNETILGDSEVNEVLSMFLEFQSKYFSKTPLADTLEKKFIWNIPKHVYDLANKVKSCDLPDAMNPIYWLYGLCTEDPELMLSEFLITAINAVSNEDYSEIEKQASEYDDLISSVDDQ